MAGGHQGGAGPGDRDGGEELQQVPRYGQEEEEVSLPVSQEQDMKQELLTKLIIFEIKFLVFVFHIDVFF